MNQQEYDVIIIGGGATGAGTARDCALRGLKTLLVERHDIATGASGRNHGLLHSGARYAVNDRESAAECIGENMILRRIAANCVDPCGGLFISLPEDTLEYQAKFIRACNAAGIKAEAIDPKQALLEEPEINPDIIGAVRVPDASIDPFRLVSANILDARLHGAEILTGWEFIDFIRETVTVRGVKIRNNSTGEVRQVYAHYTVNAAGIWGAHIAKMAGATIGMLPSKGALLVFGHRLARQVVNRCRKPANADILVPGDVVSVIGTTSDKVPFEECDDMKVTPREVDILLSEGSQMVPSLSSTRIIRAYAGVRPLVSSDADPSGRSVSRGIVLLDHAKRDGIHGFISITGGKLTTYRLMAQMTADLICQKLSLDRPCQTATLPLPGSKESVPPRHSKFWTVAQKAAFGRHGGRVAMMDFSGDALKEVCECEHVSRAEIAYAVRELHVKTLDDLRRRTRVGMGTCQSSFCILKAAAALAEELGDLSLTDGLVKDFLRERWKGIRPVCWGDQLREAEYMRKMHSSAPAATLDSVPSGSYGSSVIIIGGGQGDAEIGEKLLGEGKSVTLITFGGRVGEVHAYDEFLRLGGTLLLNHRVVDPQWAPDGSIAAIHTDKLGSTPLKASAYILASGRFISGALTADMQKVREAYFDADVEYVEGHENWTAEDFFAPQSFEDFGVKTDSLGRVLRGGKAIPNLYGFGEVLAAAYRRN